MPNWVSNTLKVEGSYSDIEAVATQLAKPYTRKVFNHLTNQVETFNYEEPISFWNIIKPTDLEAYEDAEGKPQRGEGHWYNWNIKYWGTKWDACDAKIIDRDELYVVYTFNTAWSQPSPVIEALSLQYPDCRLILEYQEEQGWGGSEEFMNGVKRVLETYEG